MQLTRQTKLLYQLCNLKHVKKYICLLYIHLVLIQTCSVKVNIVTRRMNKVFLELYSSIQSGQFVHFIYLCIYLVIFTRMNVNVRNNLPCIAEPGIYHLVDLGPCSGDRHFLKPTFSTHRNH